MVISKRRIGENGIHALAKAPARHCPCAFCLVETNWPSSPQVIFLSSGLEDDAPEDVPTMSMTTVFVPLQPLGNSPTSSQSNQNGTNASSTPSGASTSSTPASAQPSTQPSTAPNLGSRVPSTISRALGAGLSSLKRTINKVQLPLSVLRPLQSAVSWCLPKIKIIRKGLNIDRRIAIAALFVAFAAGVPAYFAWDLAKWTATKDYIAYCQSNLVSPQARLDTELLLTLSSEHSTCGSTKGLPKGNRERSRPASFPSHFICKARSDFSAPSSRGNRPWWYEISYTAAGTRDKCAVSTCSFSNCFCGFLWHVIHKCSAIALESTPAGAMAILCLDTLEPCVSIRRRNLLVHFKEGSTGSY